MVPFLMSNQIHSFLLKLFIALCFFAPIFALNASAQNSFGGDLGPDIQLPGLTDFQPKANLAEGSSSAKTVRLEAVLLDEGDPIENGLVWRIFDPTPGEDGKLKLIAASEGGSIDLDFEPGNYFIHVAFGRAGVTRKLSVVENEDVGKQQFVLDAGGLILKAVSGNNRRIPPQYLTFSIYSGEDQAAQDSDRQLVLEGVRPEVIVRLNEGTYHVVSNYGDINAVTRADLRVVKGKLTEVQMQHRAAEVRFKLVSKPGGEGIADTAWAIYSSSGDIIREMAGSSPRLILSEGDYTAIALHQSKEHASEFHVSPGQNKDVEVPLTAESNL